MIAIDTNLLVYAHRAGLAEHRAARQAIEDAANRSAGWGIPLPCIAELWSVVTHPAAAQRPSRPEEVRDYLAALSEAGAVLLLPGSSFGDRLLRLAQDLEVFGNGIFDLQVGLAALDGGAKEIWTHDRRFKGIPGLSAFDPLDA